MTYPTFVRKHAVACACAGLMALSSAQAADPTLNEVSVLATKSSAPMSSTPASVSAVSQDELSLEQANTIAPLVRLMANADLGGGPRTDALIPTIRGAFGASVTLLLDGARQNDIQSPGLRAPLYADPYFLKNVEVLRGASSSLYGSGGNGGVMALTTLSARDLLAPGRAFGGGVRAGTASADDSTDLNARVYAAGEMVDGLLALGKHRWNKIKQPSGSYLDPNDGDNSTGLVKLGLQPTRDSRIELSHQFYDSDNLSANNPQVSRYKLVTDLATAAIPFIQPTHVEQRNTVLKASVGNETSSLFTASWYRTALRVLLSPFATNTAYNNAATTNTQFTETATDGGSLTWAMRAGVHRLMAGFDVFSDKLSSLSGTTTLAVNAVNPAGERVGTGFYVQDEWALSSDWVFTPSIRHDRYTVNQTNSTQPENSHSRWSPKATLAWFPQKSMMLYASYGEGYRAPAVNELYQRSTFGTFSWFQPNPALRPEVDRTVELGYKSAWTSLLGHNDRLSLRAAVFRSSVTDLISSATLGPIPNVTTCATTGLGCQYQYQNIADARRTGAEIEASYTHGLWQHRVAYGRVRVTNTNSGEQLFSPPDKLTLQIRRVLAPDGATIQWNTTAVSAQDYDSTVLRRRSGYSVHDVFINWPVAGPQVQLYAGVTNLFNKSYAVYQSGNIYANTPQAGRSVRVALGAEF